VCSGCPACGSDGAWEIAGIAAVFVLPWPERAGCGQECLSQIEASPGECLVRNILTKWYEGKVCAWCGQPFGEIDWAGRKPALLGADGVSIEWSEVPAERLQETLAAASQSASLATWPTSGSGTSGTGRRSSAPQSIVRPLAPASM